MQNNFFFKFYNMFSESSKLQTHSLMRKNVYYGEFYEIESNTFCIGCQNDLVKETEHFVS